MPLRKLWSPRTADKAGEEVEVVVKMRHFRADDYELIEALILSRAFKINSTVYEAGLPTPEEAIWHPAHALMTPEQIWQKM